MAEDKKPEPKPKSAREKMYDYDSKKAAAKKPARHLAHEPEDEHKKNEAPAAKEDAKPAGGGEGKKEEAPAKSGQERYSEEMRSLYKSHETERRDHHGNHRESLRQMAARHEKQIKDLTERQMVELTGSGGADLAAAGGTPAVAGPADGATVPPMGA